LRWSVVGAAEMSRRERVIGVLSHLWCWLGPLAIIPVVVRFTAARESAVLRQVTADVLSLQLVVLSFWVAGGVLGLAGWNLAFIALWLVYVPVIGYAYVVGAVAAYRLWKGRVWRYPLRLGIVSP
jgi:hypothetical protein